MPPKTSNIKAKAAPGTHSPKPGDQHPRKAVSGTSKATEEAAAPTSVGPIIKVSLINTAPAAAGKTFLDALQAGRRTAAAAAAPAPNGPAAESPAATPEPEPVRAAAEPAVEPSATKNVSEPASTPAETSSSSEEEPSKPEVGLNVAEEAPAAVEAPLPPQEPAEVRAASVKAAAVEAVLEPSVVENVAAAAPQNGAVPFSWATDTDDDINFQFQQPSPQFAAEYPDGVLENRAHNVTFKVPATGQTIAGAMGELQRERQSLAEERREFEERRRRQQEEESGLAKLRLQLKEEGDKLRQEGEKLRQEREELRQQQQQHQMRVSPTQSPAEQPPAHAPPKRAHTGAPDYGNVQKDWSQTQAQDWQQTQSQDWAQPMPHERWTAEMGVAPSYDLYGSVGGFPQQRSYNYRSTVPGSMGQQIRTGPPGRMPQTQLLHHMGGGIGGGMPIPQNFNNTRMTAMPGAPGMAGGRPPMDGKALNFANRNPVQQQPFNGYNKTW